MTPFVLLMVIDVTIKKFVTPEEVGRMRDPLRIRVLNDSLDSTLNLKS